MVAVAFPPDGSTAFVANDEDGIVTTVDVATFTTGTAIDVGRSPFAIAITPDGAVAYVADNSTDSGVKLIEVGIPAFGVSLSPPYSIFLSDLPANVDVRIQSN